jgi:hypothetical protein
MRKKGNPTIVFQKFLMHENKSFLLHAKFFNAWKKASYDMLWHLIKKQKGAKYPHLQGLFTRRFVKQRMATESGKPN